MNLQEEFPPGIDYFRIIAAFLVVANHTSPPVVSERDR